MTKERFETLTTVSKKNFFYIVRRKKASVNVIGGRSFIPSLIFLGGERSTRLSLAVLENKSNCINLLSTHFEGVRVTKRF